MSIGNKYKSLCFFICVLVLSGCILSNDKSNTEKSNDYIEDGKDQYQDNDFEKSAVSYNNALKLDSTNSKAYPGLMLSIIKRDSLVEKYFNISLFSNDSLPLLITFVSIEEKDNVYQQVKNLNLISEIYIDKANDGKLDNEFDKVHGVTFDVQIMYKVISEFDYNNDGKINDSDSLTE